MMSFIMPKTMKAAILTELRKPLVVTDIELPKTLQIGQVLVKVSYSGICGSQLGEIDGVKGKDNFLPQTESNIRYTSYFSLTFIETHTTSAVT